MIDIHIGNTVAFDINWRQLSYICNQNAVHDIPITYTDTIVQFEYQYIYDESEISLHAATLYVNFYMVRTEQ